MSGMIRLGPLGDVRPYMLANVSQYSRSLANQMAVKTAQGDATYADKDAYDAWVQHNWVRGVGKEADDEGFLYAEMDTRVPHQLSLPPLVKVTDGRQETPSATDIRNQISSKQGVLTAGGNSGTDRIAVYFDASAGYTLARVWVYARIPPNTTATIALYGVDGSDKPTGSPTDTATISGDTDYNFRWYSAAISETLSGEYCLVLYPAAASNTIEWAGGGSYTNAKTWTSADGGATWAAHTQLFPFFLTDVHGLNSKASVTDVVRFNDNTYVAVGNRVMKYSASNQNWANVGSARSTTITDLEVWGATLYIGLGDSTNYDTMNTSETYSGGGSAGRLFHRGANGYLWKAVANNVYYSVNGSSWSSAIAAGPNTFSVRGFAMAQDNEYVATDDGLWWIAPGDVARGLTPFPGQGSENGRDMVAHEGNVYLPVGGHLYQFSELAALQNLWKTRPEELPSSKLGRVMTVTATTHWLLAGVQPDDSAGAPSVWAWNGEGWHFMAALPNGLTLTCLRYDRALKRVWCGTSSGLVFWFYVSDYLVNPTRDGAYTFMPYGWLETDWFSSEILEDRKDFDGVYALARGMNTTMPLEVYWQDDTSTSQQSWTDEAGASVTDEAGEPILYSIVLWMKLGELTGDRGEVRWPLDSTARNSRELRLGLLISTNNGGFSPKVEAVRVKYHLMVTDWYMWTVPVLVSGDGETAQQLADGTAQNYTRDEQRSHLRSLETQVEPALYTDICGCRYEVKVRAGVETVWGEIREIGGAQEFDSVILLTLEQSARGQYQE